MVGYLSKVQNRRSNERYKGVDGGEGKAFIQVCVSVVFISGRPGKSSDGIIGCHSPSDG